MENIIFFFFAVGMTLIKQQIQNQIRSPIAHLLSNVHTLLKTISFRDFPVSQ